MAVVFSFHPRVPALSGSCMSSAQSQVVRVSQWHPSSVASPKSFANGSKASRSTRGIDDAFSDAFLAETSQHLQAESLVLGIIKHQNKLYT